MGEKGKPQKQKQKKTGSISGVYSVKFSLVCHSLALTHTNTDHTQESSVHFLAEKSIFQKIYYKWQYNGFQWKILQQMFSV